MHPPRTPPWFSTCFRWLGLSFALALLIGVSACKRPSASYASPSGYDEYAYEGDAYAGGGYGDDGYGGEAEEMVMAVEGRSMSRGGGGRARAKRSSDRPRPAPPSAEMAADMDDMSADMDGVEMGEAAQAPVSQAQPVSPVARQMIYTAGLRVAVYDVRGSIATAESLPSRIGGWMQQRQDTLIVLRVPAERLEEAMDIIGELGIVEARTLEAQDVTAEYTDIDSRIRVLEGMQTHLQALLAKAKTVEQSLEIRRALDAVTLELESLRARMRELSQSIAFSTLVIQFTARGPAIDMPTSNDPFPWIDDLGVEATEYR